MGRHFAELTTRLAEIIDLNRAESVLAWDQETYMPAGGGLARSQHLSTLAKLTHERAVAPALGRLIGSAGREPDVRKSATKGALVREAKRSYDRLTKLPTEFVAEVSRTRSLAQRAWVDARKRSDFAAFAPWLKKNLDNARRTADYYGWSDHPYDALLDVYEPGMTAAEVRRVFADLRDQTVPLVRAIAPVARKVTDAAVHGRFPRAEQEAFAAEVARQIGYDFERGRMDYSTHPFCTEFSRDDVRITTRADEGFFNTMLFSVLHEAGHATYEQGIAPALERTPLGGGASLGMHESQSRLWENLIGRSRPFWAHFYPQLQARFPRFRRVPLEAFYRAINRVQPSLIRIEADELTYNMHIFVRFELELALLEGSLKVKDLPEAWNAKYRDYLGLTPPDDAHGCLQDIHWSIGLVGYFPTYTLGNIISVQLFERVLKDIPDLNARMARGEFGALMGWLNEHVHRHGRRYRPNELLKRATGRALTAEPYVTYLRTKFGDIYGLS